MLQAKEENFLELLKEIEEEILMNELRGHRPNDELL